MKTDVKSIIKEKNRAEKKREMLNRDWYSLRFIFCLADEKQAKAMP